MFSSYVTYKEEGFTDCKNNGCIDEGICRCYKITDVKIDVNIVELSYFLYEKYYNSESVSFKRDSNIDTILNNINSEVDLYCIDRILRIHKIYDKNQWNVIISYGYYGDEIENVSIKNDIFIKIENDIIKVSEIQSFNKKIEFILKLEYGYVLDKLINKKFKIVEVDIDDIILGQKKYKESLSVSSYYDDDNYDYNLHNIKLIKGICLYNNEKWNLIDGYHRLVSTKSNKIKIIAAYD